MTHEPANDAPPDDPVFLHSRREAIVILLVWVAAFAWVIPYCYIFGYESVEDPDTFSTVLGIPSWVMWGVAVPWLIADAITIALCLWYIKDDDLDA